MPYTLSTISVNSLYHEFLTNQLPHVIQYIIFLSPFLMAILLMTIAVDLWIKYVRAHYFFSQKYVLLEIRLPKDTFKSPHAMELFLDSFHNAADGNWFAQFWEGASRPWYSLELVSLEGQVKFFIWTQAGRKAFIEANLYAQFPEVEISEHEDYARTVYFDPELYKMWATEFQFTKDDPYPIKTYIDYGLDKDPKEEFKVDPLVPLLEFLGGVGYNQQIWIQIIIQAHRKVKKQGKFFKMHDAYEDRAKELVNELLKRDPKTLAVGDEDAEGKKIPPRFTRAEEQVVEAIQRSLTKYAFDVGIRAMYIAKKDDFNPANIGGTIGSMKHFSTPHLNGFRPGGPWGAVEYPWQDYKGRRKNGLLKAALAMYKRRSYFHPPYQGKPMVMNAEELATIFHLPGSTAGTPGLQRIPSKKSQAPTNLPV